MGGAESGECALAGGRDSLMRLAVGGVQREAGRVDVPGHRRIHCPAPKTSEQQIAALPHDVFLAVVTFRRLGVLAGTTAAQ